ncbi:MAG: Lar family restriction alleviation protein [Pseudomonadota bacterium]
MIDQDVLPCPFCGSTNISDGEISTFEPGVGNYSQSECQDCGALGPCGMHDGDEPDYGSVKAIAAWNRRAKEPT